MENRIITSIKYWLLVILFSVGVTYLFHLAMSLFWNKQNNDYTGVASVEGFVTVFVLPIYLTILNYYCAKKFNVNYILYFINIIIVLYCVYLSSYLGFENWATSIGDKLNPDNETLEVFGFQRTLGYLFSMIGLIVGIVKLKKLNKIRSY
ncbi:hypothetical protein [uncultured Flavobacterium sp.]|uniref:hypothetical protein n=1 Tax=uncultured Flavobacterium sp. TaxID=165435 RepID=UPI00292EFC7B|nr:hypothetical protein [uncultured Flavobacterium sp.]